MTDATKTKIELARTLGQKERDIKRLYDYAWGLSEDGGSELPLPEDPYLQAVARLMKARVEERDKLLVGMHDAIGKVIA